MTALLRFTALSTTLLLLTFILLAAPTHTVYAQSAHDSAPVGAAAVTASITLTPTADTYVQSDLGGSNFATLPELQVRVDRTFAAIDANALLQFDLSVLPAGAIINRAELRLRQTTASGLTWSVNLNRITSPWTAATVTWNSRPSSTAFYTALPVPDPGGDPNIVFDVTELVRTWVYNGSPNYGLEIAGNGGTAHSRRFASVNATANRPELFIDYTPPPTSIQIGEDTAPVTLDGQCSVRTEYAQATSFAFVDIPGQTATVYLKHDAQNIYLCIDAPLGSFPLRAFGVYLDTDFGREKYATADDYGLLVRILDSANSALRGTGNPNAVYESMVLDGWKAVAATGNRDGAEYQIARSLFGRACATPFGLAIYHQDVRDNGETYGLPTGRNLEFPSSWLEATLANPGCIRVCSETALPCPAAASATVINAQTGVTFTLDSEGYLINRDQITDGDSLWALLPVSTTSQSTLYHTNGDPQKVTGAAFRDANQGTMTLVVTKQKPLLVQDLAIAAQWYVQGDPTREAWLRDSILHAADFLYEFTDGQFTLGKVTVQQSYDGWSDADLQLHISNSFQPRAVIGGIVPTDTVDISPTVQVTYSPGSMVIGSHWNRFGTPPGEPVTLNDAPVPTETLELDWSLALAHELGHYLLYLFDTYTDVDGNASQDLAKLCTGSAMGDVYTPANRAFTYNDAHWDTNCKDTEAYTTLAGRTEWETIQLWYPWTIVPTGFVTGPVLPAGVTQVTFVTPTVSPGELATSQLFDLLYQDNETSSGEARVFILRNNRVFEQGKPAAEATQIQLIDAQLGDRLCIYDVNDHAENDDTPRHQFGCEIVKPNDAAVQMTKDVTWAPLVTLQQTGSNQLTLAVTQTVTQPVDAQIVARLYPEHGEQSAEIALTGDGNNYSGQFNLTQPVPPVYVQLSINETVPDPATPREVMVDRGTGGSGAFGPARHAGKVLVISSDGNAAYESDEPLNLEPGESIAWQSMPGTPPLPPTLDILGQSYRLDAYPPSLIEGGKVNIQFEERATSVQAVGMNQGIAAQPAIYFWNGISWRQLTTTLTTPVNAADGEQLASAPSQGVGVYAVIIDEGQDRLFLPFVAR